MRHSSRTLRGSTAIAAAASALLILVTAACATHDVTGSEPAARSAADETMHGVYRKRCSSCHELPRITKFDDEQWLGIMPSMAREARMSKSAEAALTEFLLRHN
jgi:hypothetical protein